MIVAGQRSGREVRVFSSGSALDGFPNMYQESPMEGHDGPVRFREVLGFAPLGPQGGSVALTSTVDGADLLVSSGGEVRKFALARAEARVLAARALGRVDSGGPAVVGGD